MSGNRPVGVSRTDNSDGGGQLAISARGVGGHKIVIHMASMAAEPYAVGLRDLRHHTSEVLARVRHGETVDVTEHGRLIARIVPVGEREPTPILARLVASGRATLARRPGYRPRMRPGDGSDRLSQTLAAMRDEEGW